LLVHTARYEWLLYSPIFLVCFLNVVLSFRLAGRNCG
jgi:hypothetical protein